MDVGNAKAVIIQVGSIRKFASALSSDFINKQYLAKVDFKLLTTELQKVFYLSSFIAKTGVSCTTYWT